MSDVDRRRAADELARRLADELERRSLAYLEAGGLVRVKLLLVDAGGERRIVTLESPGWSIEPRQDAGEKLFLEAISLIGVERAEGTD